MPAHRQHREPRVGRMVSDEATGFMRREVLIARHHEHRQFKLCKLGAQRSDRQPVGERDAHELFSSDRRQIVEKRKKILPAARILGLENRPLGRLLDCREGFGCSTLCNIVSQRPRASQPPLAITGAGAGTNHHQAMHTLGMREGEIECDIAASCLTDEVRTPDTKGIKQSREIIDQLPVQPTVVITRHGGRRIAAPVVGNRPIASTEEAQLRLPGPRIARVFMAEHHRQTGSHTFVVEPDAV